MRSINNLVGGCAIAVGIKEHTSISGSALRTVIDYLFQKMFTFSSCSLGGERFAISRNSGKMTRKQGLYRYL